jgi:arylsulfatase A-like enzyme
MRIVLVLIDALQPAYLGPYGNEWFETPTFDRLAARGVVFDQHFADVPSSDSPSWRTGRHAALGRSQEPDLVERLESAGVTALPATRGLRVAWDKHGKSEHALVVVEVNSLRPPWKTPAKILAPFFAEDAVDDEGRSLEPWRDPLPARIDPEDDVAFERLQLTYAAAVTHLDANLGDLIESCADRGWTDALWILTSVRGMPLGEHAHVGFPAPLNEEFVHLPLIVIWPDGAHAGRRVSALTQPMDLAPTLAELFGVAWPMESDSLAAGRSLLPLIHSPVTMLRPQAITTDGEPIGVRNPEWYWLRPAPDRPAQLFVKPDDRWEIHDVHLQQEVVTEDLERIAGEFSRRYINPGAK